MARPLKRLLGSDAVRAVLLRLTVLYIRLCHATGRWTTRGPEIPAAYWHPPRPCIVAFWHGRLLMMPFTWTPDVPMNMLASRHRDGRFIARAVGHFGIRTIIGSSSKGGAQALRAMLKVLRADGAVGITPDGPRGPRMRASAGVIALARLSGAPILPATYAVSRAKVLGTWDRFILPLPFARGVFVWGEPITVARDADEAAQEVARRHLESVLNELCAGADRICGRAPIEPAPEPEPEPEPEPRAGAGTPVGEEA